MLAAQRRLVGSARPARVVHEVESLDVHVANPDYRVAAPAELLVAGRMPPHQRLQLLVSVDGVVRFGDGPQAVVKTFHENFILVPNWDVLAQTRSGGRPTTRYLISSQNFRRAG